MEVQTRAPGKIILTGEHAVVHGSTAIAAAIDLYTNISIRIQENSDGAVELELRDVNLMFSWPSSKITEALSEFGSLVPHPLAPNSCSTDRFKALSKLVDEHNIPEAKIWLASGVSAFLYLYTSIHGVQAGRVVVSSELPMGAGLGSSASFCVGVSSAMLVSAGVVCAGIDRGSGWVKLKQDELDLVNKWAFEGERIIHGRPSGIDNTVSTFGGVIKFKSGKLTQLKASAPLRMLITNTKVGRNTKALVAGVSERALRHPEAMASVFNAVESISQEFAGIIESPALDEIAVTAKEEKIEELMEMNQGLLQCMGVSHASIETVLRTTLKYKLASKLTGAGGGGCVLTLLPTLLSSTIVDKVIDELESCGFQCLKVEVGGQGLQVSF